jgi:hypothetical protein
MDYKLKLDEWLAENEAARIDYLRQAVKLKNIWQNAYIEARDKSRYVTKTISDGSGLTGKKDIKVAVLNINGIEYLHTFTQQISDFNRFFNDNDCQALNKGDLHLVRTFKIEDIIRRVKKETAMQRADIIARTQRILEGEPIEVQDYGGALVLIAENGKKAKMWAIEAGGHNVQCYHIRILVKETC